MWRALFLGLGIYACLLGGECLVIDRAVLSGKGDRTGLMRLDLAKARELVPSDWAPWSLLSAGAVTILYSFTIPQRMQKT